MIRVLSPGFYATIQDAGRFGYADKGVPCSGAMDQYAAQLANQIIGNTADDAVLEIALGKCELEFNNEIVVCVSGAHLSAKLNESVIDLNKPIQVVKNDIISFGKPIFGVRAYLAVKGGFQTPIILKSRSFYQGITAQFVLKKDTMLPVLKLVNKKNIKYASVKFDKAHFSESSLMVYPGPEYELLNDQQKKQLSSTLFSISNDNNRMGYRLEGVVANELPTMLSSAVLPGTVQLTPSGRLIILMRDCQVTGGYPRVLQLSDTAINRLAQKTTRDTIQFKLEPQEL